MSNLFGTELANEMMDELAAQKRTSAPSRVKSGPKIVQSAKLEQLRSAKKQRKLDRKFEVDLTLDQELMDLTEGNEDVSTRDEVALDYKLGDEVTAIEGTGSATRQYKGVVVEIDRTNDMYIIGCRGVSNYPHGYNMVVPFTESQVRINQQLHTEKRKRKRRVLMDL